MTSVYFIKPIGMDSPIKIGCSRCAKGRLAEIARWAPMPLEIIGTVPGSFKDERTLHRRFAHLQEHLEWFTADAELLRTIDRVIKAGSVSAVLGDAHTGADIRTPGHRKWTIDRRLRQSFSRRLAYVRDRLNKEQPAGWDTPVELKEIMRAWSHGKRPDKINASKLDRYLADPVEYVAASEQRAAA